MQLLNIGKNRQAPPPPDLRMSELSRLNQTSAHTMSGFSREGGEWLEFFFFNFSKLENKFLSIHPRVHTCSYIEVKVIVTQKLKYQCNIVFRVKVFRYQSILGNSSPKNDNCKNSSASKFTKMRFIVRE